LTRKGNALHIAILDRTPGWHYHQLREAAGPRHQVSFCNFENAHAAIAGDGKRTTSFHCSRFQVGAIDFASVDCVIVRGMPAGSLEQVVFRMDWLDQLCSQYPIVAINPAKTIEASVDKYLSLERIRRAGLAVPLTSVAQTVDAALDHFEQLGCDSVIKPIFGSCGRGIRRIQSVHDAEIAFQALALSGSVIYQQQYIEHGDQDVRILVIGDLTYGMVRKRPGNWITNIHQGAAAVAHVPSRIERQIAVRAARAVNAYLAGVDIVYEIGGPPYVVEINASPSWRAISQTISDDPAVAIIRLAEILARDPMGVLPMSN
jgi:ribosomal protein S6--L-glutamate ligase